ncbi:methylated-DNA--[protein]-cysteine S-methyltransferase [Gillisia limnaea]|uniref:Methylated-DNA--protein-cysteine methyltransferase n=1 Tax=Gillisia limnaea (strain DSM 15749 / LMG 21470 / R-8282) TaxID=865937 RepID=H2BT18_GILLR|nr:methylated-DNA--[protein]-cysteine S-methyltransferase [Gillisia limnaea]EHQ02576.1 methylated-DNA/protein-cysteinemethyltransferase [Gillisia limnaea DSM 15749]
MTISLKTPLGICEITGDEDGISEIRIVDEERELSDSVPEILIPAVKQIEAYFRGELKDFSLKLNPEGTPFQKTVWQSLREIPFGKTNSYMEISKNLGAVKAIRAVAAANGKNPLWIVIPCHRVIGSDGSLTGYAGGLWRKKWLLEHENPSSQQSLF